MDITAKGGGTGRWSRRNSIAGNECLKMDDEVRGVIKCYSCFDLKYGFQIYLDYDTYRHLKFLGKISLLMLLYLPCPQMVTVQRNGVSMQIPRKLSHHIPVIPIWQSTNFIDTISLKFFDLNSDEFQIYKQVKTGIIPLSAEFC